MKKNQQLNGVMRYNELKHARRQRQCRYNYPVYLSLLMLNFQSRLIILIKFYIISM